MSASGAATNHLRSFIHRVQNLEEERDAITADIKEVYAEAKGSGFDTKIMREVVRILKMPAGAYEEKCAMVEQYLWAIKAPEQVRVEVRAVLAEEAPAAPASA